MKCSEPIKMSYSYKKPWKIVQDGEDVIYVDCGKCNNCKLKKIGKWESRLKMEYQYLKTFPNPQIIFTTLTYNRRNINKTQDDYGTHELQKWIKRLRGLDKKTKRSKNNLKYFGVFERGGNKGRIHHHILLFCENEIIKREPGGEMQNGSYYFNSKMLKWENGTNWTSILPLKTMQDTGAVVSYINKYILKEPLKYVYSQKIGYTQIRDDKKKYYVFDSKLYSNPKYKGELSLEEIIQINGKQRARTGAKVRELKLHTNKELENIEY